MIFRLVLLSSLILLLPLSAIANDAPIRVGFYDNPPKLYQGEDGSFRGFFPELIQLIAEAEGWDLHFVPGSWTEGLDRLEAGDLDIMPDVALTPERQDRFLFGEETALISWAVIYTRPTINIGTFFDLEDMAIALLRGSVYDTGDQSIRNLLEQFNIQATFVTYDSHDDVFAAIESGTVDAGVVNNIFGASLETDYRVRRTPIVFSPSRLHFAFPKHLPESEARKETIDRHLRSMQSGPGPTLGDLMDRHLYGRAPVADPTPAPDMKWLTAEEQAWLDAHPTIRLGYDPEFVPFEFRNANGEFSGIASEYVAIFAEELGIQLEPIPNAEWTEVMEGIRSGQFDVLSCVGYSEERASFLLFSEPYLEFHRVILTRTDAPFITGLRDLRDLRIGVQEASSHEMFLKERTTYAYHTYPSTRESLLALSSGEIDALVGNLASYFYWIRRLHLLNIKVAAPASPEINTLHFAVRSDWPELRDILNKALQHIDEARRREIQQRWVSLEFEPDRSRQIAWRVAVRSALIFGVLLGLTLLWLRHLKREIQHRKRIEAELTKYAEDMRIANLKLEDMDRLKNMFIASVSHELRTPLNSIIGFSGVLLKGMTGELNDRQNDQLSRIYKSAQHLLDLITDIIDISKIEAGRVDVFPRSFDLSELIQECAEAIQPQLQSKPLTLSVECDEPIQMRTDRKRLRQCLLNYLSNAVKYSEQGHIQVEVKRLSGDRVAISVQDEGIGISGDDLVRLFQPFERMDSHLRVKAGGTGLGLYLTRKIVTEILHGRTSVTSSPGKGSLFSFTVPIDIEVIKSYIPVEEEARKVS